MTDDERRMAEQRSIMTSLVGIKPKAEPKKVEVKVEEPKAEPIKAKKAVKTQKAK